MWGPMESFALAARSREAPQIMLGIKLSPSGDIDAANSWRNVKMHRNKISHHSVAFFTGIVGLVDPIKTNLYTQCHEEDSEGGFIGLSKPRIVFIMFYHLGKR